MVLVNLNNQTGLCHVVERNSISLQLTVLSEMRRHPPTTRLLTHSLALFLTFSSTCQGLSSPFSFLSLSPASPSQASSISRRLWRYCRSSQFYESNPFGHHKRTTDSTLITPQWSFLPCPSCNKKRLILSSLSYHQSLSSVKLFTKPWLFCWTYHRFLPWESSWNLC